MGGSVATTSVLFLTPVPISLGCRLTFINGVNHLNNNKSIIFKQFLTSIYIWWHVK